MDVINIDIISVDIISDVITADIFNSYLHHQQPHRQHRHQQLALQLVLSVRYAIRFSGGIALPWMSLALLRMHCLFAPSPISLLPRSRAFVCVERDLVLTGELCMCVPLLLECELCLCAALVSM